jgi:hypothetical protein
MHQIKIEVEKIGNDSKIKTLLPKELSKLQILGALEVAKCQLLQDIEVVDQKNK